MKSVFLCHEMGWTLDQYRAQPLWFITSLLSLMQNQAEEMNRRNKQS